MLQPLPHRSQSFRHRPRPNALLYGKINLNQNINDTNELIETTNDSTPERRRSTPTINRRSSLRGGGIRLDTWPEPKQVWW
jgi:hypothetical protein